MLSDRPYLDLDQRTVNPGNDVNGSVSKTRDIAPIEDPRRFEQELKLVNNGILAVQVGNDNPAAGDVFHLR